MGFFYSFKSVFLLFIKKLKLDGISKLYLAFSEDEFQAKYHSYYVNFDEHVGAMVNPTAGEIVDEFDKFLKLVKDKTWTWYFSTEEFKFSHYLSDNQQRILFKKVINPIVDRKDGVYRDDLRGLRESEIDVTYLSVSNMIKSYWNKIKEFFMGKEPIKMSDEDMLKMNRNLKMFEKNINEKRNKYKRRMERLITIMVEKYAK